MKKDNKPYDTAFKDLAEQDPELLLLLVGALPPGATVKLLPREVTTPALLPDQPYEVTGPGTHFVAHIEAQTRYIPPMPDRFVEYDAYLWIKHRLPIHSFLLVFLPAGMPDDPPTTVTMQAGGFTIIVTYTIIKLWEMSAKWALALGRESLLPFVPLMEGGLAETEQSATRISQIEDPVRKQELSVHFVMLGGLRYNRADLLDLLGRIPMIPMELYKESSFYQMAVEEGRDEEREEGRVRLSNLFRALAQRRFPGADLSTEIERVHDLDALEQLCLSLDQFSSIEMLRARLAELAVRPS